MTFNPSLKDVPMTSMNVTVRWDALQWAPHIDKKKGGVYMAYTIGTKGGPGGYFGVQLISNRGKYCKKKKLIFKFTITTMSIL